jgi:hypothetical protein
MAEKIEWMTVTDRGGKKDIGAVGFLGHDPAIIVVFYDEKDADKSGDVSWGEWVASTLSPISLSGVGKLEVVSRAREQATLGIANSGTPINPSKAQNLRQMQGEQLVSVGQSMILDGIFAAYLSKGVSAGATAAAKKLTTNTIKQFFIRKGFEKAAKESFNAALK